MSFLQPEENQQKKDNAVFLAFNKKKNFSKEVFCTPFSAGYSVVQEIRIQLKQLVLSDSFCLKKDNIYLQIRSLLFTFQYCFSSNKNSEQLLKSTQRTPPQNNCTSMAYNRVEYKICIARPYKAYSKSIRLKDSPGKRYRLFPSRREISVSYSFIS